MKCKTCQINVEQRSVRCPQCRAWLLPSSILIFSWLVLTFVLLRLIGDIFVIFAARDQIQAMGRELQAVGSGLIPTLIMYTFTYLVLLAILGVVLKMVWSGKKAVWHILTFLLGVVVFVVNLLQGATVLKRAEGLPAMIILITFLYVGLVLWARSKRIWNGATGFFLGSVIILVILEVILNLGQQAASALVFGGITTTMVSWFIVLVYSPSFRTWFRPWPPD